MKTEMLTLKFVALLLAGAVLLSGCASTTLIQSEPSGAKLYVDGELVGTTPFSHTDKKIIGSTTYVTLRKEGYETLNTTFSRDEEVDVGAIIGGFFVWIPFLWTMKYKPVRTYELIPSSGEMGQERLPLLIREMGKTKTEKLRELKELLDEKIITPEEFEAEKKKILEEDE